MKTRKYVNKKITFLYKRKQFFTFFLHRLELNVSQVKFQKFKSCKQVSYITNYMKRHGYDNNEKLNYFLL